MQRQMLQDEQEHLKKLPTTRASSTVVQDTATTQSINKTAAVAATTSTAIRTSALQTTFIAPLKKTQTTVSYAAGTTGQVVGGYTKHNNGSTIFKRILPTTSQTRVFAHPTQQPQPQPASSSAANCRPLNAETIAAIATSTLNTKKMEHSYTHNIRPSSELTGLSAARTILVRRPAQCPSCHLHPLEEHDLDDGNQVQIPSYNEISAKEAMCECERIAKYVKNVNPDEEDWESRINQIGWSNVQKQLFSRVAHILDNDQLGRLANAGRQNEPMQRRVVVDKSASRMRKVFASVAWDTRLTQWLHSLLMDSLPATYMASYLDILQTLKSKLPTLIDKMLFGRPLNISQELLAPVLKKRWEPTFVSKSRKLAQNAVIVALPSMPTSGPMPHRLQKWYKQLTSITQIVQITLPMTTGHTARQPLEQVAEQIVSITRVKIQELRNENPSRNIILVGFNAGAALALQVAMSEAIACVVCMGFAYHTFNGARGAPDDRILDIKVPILFVIGQNSARSSPEELESLREKMQSETSLVIVGSADDALRVPKSRRKIENVTQTMIDAMVVDEIYEFIKKTLTNPPGPRVPTAITSAVYPKSAKAGNLLEGLASKTTPVQRKRKLDTTGDNVQSLTKPKYMQIGRPRTRPLSSTPKTTNSYNLNTQKLLTSTPVGSKHIPPKPTQLSPSSITNEDLNLAIQSILDDANDNEGSLNTSTSSDSTAKQMTNFELVTPSKSASGKSTLLSPLPKHTVVGSNSVTPIGTKIKMIPSNQFMQIKPSMQSQSKIYTIKTATLNQTSGNTSIGSIVKTSPNPATTGQQQIFTLKSPSGQTTQYVTAAPPTAQQKYTVVKNATGGTTLQLTSPSAPAASTAKIGSTVDLSNIIDMPIVFADNDGNLTDSVSTDNEAAVVKAPQTSAVKPGVGQLIISQKIIKEATPIVNTNTTTSATTSGVGSVNKSPFIISKSTLPLSSTGLQQQGTVGNKKLVFINRNNIKPCGNILTRPNVAQQMQKFTKVVVSNPKASSTTIVPRPTPSGNSYITTIGSSFVSTVKQVNLQTLKTNANTAGTGIVSVSPKNLQSVQIIGSTAPTSTATTSTNVAGGENKVGIRNIVVKPGGLKQIPAHLKSQLLNRNLTVRKLVNIVPVSNASGSSVVTTSPTSTTGTASGLQHEITTDTSTINTGPSIQTSPKIIKLNPINPIAKIE